MLTPIDARRHSLFINGHLTVRASRLDLVRPDLEFLFAPGTFYVFRHWVLDSTAARAKLI